MKKIFVAVAVVIVLGGGVAFVLTRGNNDSETSSPSNSTSTSEQQPTDTSGSSSAQSGSSATITYDGNNFAPNQLTVTTGTTVTIANTSDKNLQFDSNPHPAHTDNKELNVGVIAAGQSKTFTVTTKGTFGYHNHLNSSDTGTLVVQ